MSASFACRGQRKAAPPAPHAGAQAAPAQQRPAEAERPERARARQPAVCPFAASDVRGKVEDIEGGAAITLTGGPERVGQLRTAAGELAALYEQTEGMRAMAPESPRARERDRRGMHERMQRRGMRGGGMRGGMRGGMHMGGVALPPVEIGVSEVGSGVRTSFVAREREDVPAVRSQVFRMYQHMRAGMCAPMIGLCPFGLPEVNAEATDVEGGAAVTFTADPERTPLLRAAADNLVSMYYARKRMHGERGGPGMMRNRGPMAGMRGMVPADVRAEEVEGGVRMVFLAQRSEDVSRLREHVFSHLARMREGRCRMAMGPGPAQEELEEE